MTDWQLHKDAIRVALAQRMWSLNNDQLRDIAINDCDPHKRVAAIEELTKRLKA